MQLVIQKDELESMIRNIVSETVEIEMMKLRASLLHFVSVDEQNDIDELYGTPTPENERDIADSVTIKI